ncbi:hypothetical protein AC579_8199 [Pseudocercospora musae]|uniref:Uncharacterized protein n=1 Tax=Pseudocercospora musae TaxID=113226 RepID=A0A139I666_9PEZI|nr:hypothetical protein AC579_8199 [Pseudocercospora musae]
MNTDFSPYAQKVKLLLASSNIPFYKCDQPAVLPRKDLENLGITYRRIPLLAVGKDVYIDSSKIIDIISTSLGKIRQSSSDKAFQVWGDTVFQEVLTLIPMKVLTPDFVKDRQTIFPLLTRPDLKTIRPSGLAQFQARLAEFEHQFLSQSTPEAPFIGGSKEIGLADIHAIWPIRWALNDLGAKGDGGVGKDVYPKTWRVLEMLPETNPKPEKTVSGDEAKELILGSQCTARELGVGKDDAFGLESGTEVTVESFDAKPGMHPQFGKLVGTDIDESVVELKENGVRLHFPRIGYLVRNLQDSPAKL